MPFTEAEEKQIRDGLGALSGIQASLATIGQQVGEYKGWIARVDGAVKELKEKKPDDTKPDDKPKPDWQQALDKVTGELAAEKNRNAVLAAVAKEDFFEPDLNADEILKSVVVKDGKLVVPGKKIVSGVEVAVEMTLDEAVKQLAASKPYRVKAKINGGAGAGGGQATISEDASYEELMADPQKLKEYSEKYPGKFEAKQNASFEARRKEATKK